MGLRRDIHGSSPGDDNTITVDTVEKINASGDDNNITWKRAVKGKAPGIASKGEDNKIRQAGN